MIAIRPATTHDVGAITALMTREIALGHVLPRTVVVQDFLVAHDGAHLVGTVSLSAQSSRVTELGALVSTLRGVGLGQRLVEAAMAEAEARGFTVVMALTAIPSFFERVGFRGSSHAPWIAARQELAMPHPLPLAPSEDALEASHAKSKACIPCPRLAQCQQVLLLRALPAQRLRRA